MKYFKIKIPQSLSDYRISHYNSFTEFVNSSEIVFDSIYFLSNLTKVGKNKIKTLRKEDINKMMALVFSSFSKFELKEPPKEIILNGKEYELINPEKVGYGWWLDIKSLDWTKHHLELASMFYVEKGLSYCEVDENDNIINTNEYRQNEFEQHMPLPLYLNCRSFFLQKLSVLTKLSIQKKQTEIRIMQKLNNLANSRSWTRLMRWLRISRKETGIKS